MGPHPLSGGPGVVRPSAPLQTLGILNSQPSGEPSGSVNNPSGPGGWTTGPRDDGITGPQTSPSSQFRGISQKKCGQTDENLKRGGCSNPDVFDSKFLTSGPLRFLRFL